MLQNETIFSTVKRYKYMSVILFKLYIKTSTKLHNTTKNIFAFYILILRQRRHNNTKAKIFVIQHLLCHSTIYLIRIQVYRFVIKLLTDNTRCTRVTSDVGQVTGVPSVMSRRMVDISDLNSVSAPLLYCSFAF